MDVVFECIELRGTEIKKPTFKTFLILGVYYPYDQCVMCAYPNFQLATSDGCNCIFRRMMVGGGEEVGPVRPVRSRV